MPKDTVIAWANRIKDHNLHHIGEYYTERYGKPWKKKDDELSKGLINWLLMQSTNEIERQLLPKFEFIRDSRSMAYYIKRK